MKLHPEFSPEKGGYNMVRKDPKTGDLIIRDTVPMVERMETATAIRAIAGYASSVGTLRAASLNLFTDVLDFGAVSMADYKGGTPRDKAVPREINGTFQRVEARFFERLIQPDNPDAEAFIKALPKLNERQEPLTTNGKLSTEKRLEYFLTQLRKAGSYAEVKTYALAYFAYLGESPRAATGQCVPVEVMRARVDEFRVRQQADNSYTTKALAVMRELVMPADPGKPVKLDDKRLAELLDMGQRFVDAVKAAQNDAALRATKLREVAPQHEESEGVKAMAQEALDNAQADAMGIGQADPAPVAVPQAEEVQQ